MVEISNIKRSIDLKTAPSHDPHTCGTNKPIVPPHANQHIDRAETTAISVDRDRNSRLFFFFFLFFTPETAAVVTASGYYIQYIHNIYIRTTCAATNFRRFRPR